MSSMDELIGDMLKAVETDIESIEKGEPGLAKLRLLARVEEQTSKQSLQDAFIDAGGLSAMREWLRLLPDNSLPNLTLRSSLLAILQKLTPSITMENLKESKVGHAVRDVIFHDEETAANRRIANEIAESWLRAIYGRDNEHLANKASDEDMRMSQVRRKEMIRRSRVDQNDGQDDEDYEEGRRRNRSAIATLTKNSGKDSTLFKLQPVARVQRASASGGPAGAYGERISRAVQLKHVKKTTTTKVSVEGRGLQ